MNTWYAVLGLLLVLVSARSVQGQARIAVEPLPSSACSGQFVAHDLPHLTRTNAEPITTFDSNGAGLAINDLNGDGQLDIVLANLDGPVTLLWSQGAGLFDAEVLDVPGRARGVLAVDVEGDDWTDLLITTQLGAPVMLRNQRDGTFALEVLPGVERPAYAMDWADSDGDGDLDFATASYDADLEKTLRDTFLFGDGAGVFYYEQQDGQFVHTRLAESAQALAVMFTDFSNDGLPEIAVGNDFAVADQFWQRGEAGWIPYSPFEQTTHSTMSFAVGDIQNDGIPEFFATDMKPYVGENQTNWTPVLRLLQARGDRPDDEQIPENMLQVRANDSFSNRARLSNAFATGWSWSAKFGDLNSDGWLDLYVVNGMIAEDLFGHLPGNELVEENQALRNQNGRIFVPAPEWALNSTRSGRSMSMADLDGDGDLDIVVNNLATAAQWFENQICGGDNLIVRLRDETTLNTMAIGAQVRLVSRDGTRSRTVRASSGYLSGDPAEVHFGVPVGSESLTLEVTWPDGEVTTTDVPPNSRVTLHR